MIISYGTNEIEVILKFGEIGLFAVSNPGGACTLLQHSGIMVCVYMRNCSKLSLVWSRSRGVLEGRDQAHEPLLELLPLVGGHVDTLELSPDACNKRSACTLLNKQESQLTLSK